MNQRRPLCALLFGPEVLCACAESMLGVGTIVAGSTLLLAWTPIVFTVNRVLWPVAVGGLGTLGFLTRHLVFDWRARRFRRYRE